ncbi:MAG: hypothetical protein ABSA33_03055 [Candidatus Micrarchaeaceae archaeon]
MHLLTQEQMVFFSLILVVQLILPSSWASKHSDFLLLLMSKDTTATVAIRLHIFYGYT